MASVGSDHNQLMMTCMPSLVKVLHELWHGKVLFADQHTTGHIVSCSFTPLQRDLTVNLLCSKLASYTVKLMPCDCSAQSLIHKPKVGQQLC